MKTCIVNERGNVTS